MAERPFQPVPNTPLVADPTGDAIWKRWLQGLQRFLASAVRGPGSSTDNAVARWYGTSGQFLNNSGVIIDDSNNVSGIVNLTTTGNTILGDASADTLTINAGTWTIGSNYTATRAAGTVATGQITPIVNDLTFTGDAGGGTRMRAFVWNSYNQGANAVDSHRAAQFRAEHAGSATVGTLNPLIYNITSSGSGAVTLAYGVLSALEITGGATTTACNLFAANVPIISSGAVTTLYGFRALDLGNANITTAIGIKIDDFTNSTTMRGIQSSLSAGSGKHNLYIDGTADNVIAGNVRIGSTTAPTVALDVTGAALVSTTLGVTGIQTNGNKIYPGTDAAATQSAAGIYAGTGAPNNANGSDGDFYLRSDGGVLTTIYQRRAGAWVGVV